MDKDEKPEERMEHVVEGSPFIDNSLGEVDKELSYGENPEGEIIDLIDEIRNDEEGLGPVSGEADWILDDEKIYDLVDVIEEVPERVLGDQEFNDKIVEKVSVIAEKIARELVPEIAERVIREEIEKLKSNE